MTGRSDLIFAFSAAAAIHAGALALGLSDTGRGGAGDGGADRISIEAVSPAIASLVQEWDTPPEVTEAAELQTPVPASLAPTKAPAPDAPVTMAWPPTMNMPDIAQTPVTPTTAAPVLPKVADLVEVPLRPASETVRMPLPSTPELLTPSTDAALKATSFAPPPNHVAQQATTRPAPRPAREPAPLVTRQVATGIGTTGTRGSAQNTPAPKASKAQRNAATQAWAANIQRRIARHHIYPRGTRAEGRVRVAMVILPSGRLDRVSVAKTSGTAALDNAAVAAVRRAAPFPPAPDILNEKWFDVGQWISFERR